MTTVKLEARFVDGFGVAGRAYRADDPGRRFVVELLVNGSATEAAIADRPDDDLRSEGVDDGRYAFLFPLPRSLATSARTIEVRIANRDDVPGVRVEPPAEAKAPPPAGGAVEWSGGLRFTGWLASQPGAPPPAVAAYIDEQLVEEAQALGFRQIGSPRPGPQRSFDFHLPRRYADGQVWRVRFRAQDGRELAGSPVSFLAFADGLETALAPSSPSSPSAGLRARAQLFDRLLPGGAPFSSYSDLRTNFVPRADAAARTRWAVVVLDGDDLQRTLDSVETQTLSDWTCGVLGASDDPFAFAPEDLLAFVEGHATEADWFLFVLAGVALDPGALARFGSAADGGASLIYCDREVEGEGGALWPLALPAFDHERMLEQPYFAPAFALPRATVLAAAQAEIGDVFRLANVAFDDGGGEDAALHLPGPAVRHRPGLLAGGLARFREATRAHLAVRGVAATVNASRRGDGDPFCRVRRHPTRRPSVSIVVPMRDGLAGFRRCVDSLAPAAAKAGAEIVVIDNESREPETIAQLQSLTGRGVAVLREPGRFGFARLCNAGARRVHSDILCFVSPELVALDDDWLEEMVSRHVDPRVGAVGAKTIWPSGLIDHAGFVLGINFAAAPAFRDRPDGDPGYGGCLRCARRTGAVSSACMTTPRALFLDLGGFDSDRYPSALADLDYGLRVSARGHSVIVTPHATLRRDGGDARRDDGGDARLETALRAIRNAWGEALIDDPDYNPLLALSDPPYSALAWPPRALLPRSRRPPIDRRPPAGF